MIALHFNRETDKVETGPNAKCPDGNPSEPIGPTTGWGQSPSGESTYYPEFHFYVHGTSVCKHWMSMWNTLDHTVSDPRNCKECVEVIRAQKPVKNPYVP